MRTKGYSYQHPGAGNDLITPPRGQSGFGVLEVLAAIVLFLVVAAGLAATTVGSIKANSTSNEITTAGALVHDKIEQFRALDPDTAPADLTPGYHADPKNPLTHLGERGGIFERSWEVTPNTPAIGVSEVAVTVTWNGPETRSLMGVTYVCARSSCN